MKGLHIVTFILLLIGGLNWLLIGLFSFDIVSALFGDMSGLSRIIYTLVGISAVFELFVHWGNCKLCSSEDM
jgi:uncharacterized protein